MLRYISVFSQYLSIIYSQLFLSWDNLDFPAGPTYYMLGIDIPFFTPIFVIARVVGWTAHIAEQNENNALIRPLSAYNGEAQRSVEA